MFVVTFLLVVCRLLSTPLVLRRAKSDNYTEIVASTTTTTTVGTTSQGFIELCRCARTKSGARRPKWASRVAAAAHGAGHDQEAPALNRTHRQAAGSHSPPITIETVCSVCARPVASPLAPVRPDWRLLVGPDPHRLQLLVLSRVRAADDRDLVCCGSRQTEAGRILVSHVARLGPPQWAPIKRGPLLVGPPGGVE